MAKRRTFSAEFKARVALEALSGAHTIAELASMYKVHPNMITQWKRKVRRVSLICSPGKVSARKLTEMRR